MDWVGTGAVETAIRVLKDIVLVDSGSDAGLSVADGSGQHRQVVPHTGWHPAIV